MIESGLDNDTKIWKKFLRNHWKICIVFIIAAIVAFVGAILVYLWLVSDAQLTGLVPSTLNLWAMSHVISFLFHLLFWEAVIIGIPVLIFVGAIYFLWWNYIPDDEKEEYKREHLFFGKRSHRSDGSGIISFLIFIAFIIKIYFDGNWSVAFATWTFDYLVYSCLWSLIWVLIIFGIPIAIGGTVWLLFEMKKIE